MLELTWLLLLPVQTLQARNVQLEQAVRSLRQERNALLATLRKHDCLGKALGASAVLPPVPQALHPQTQQHVHDEPCNAARCAEAINKSGCKGVHPWTPPRPGKSSPGACSSGASGQNFDVRDDVNSNGENCSLSGNKSAVPQTLNHSSAYGQLDCRAADTASAWPGCDDQAVPAAPPNARQHRLRQLQDLADSLLL